MAAMGATKGYGCMWCSEWESVMVPLWLGWWLPTIHLWLHEKITHREARM